MANFWLLSDIVLFLYFPASIVFLPLEKWLCCTEKFCIKTYLLTAKFWSDVVSLWTQHLCQFSKKSEGMRIFLLLIWYGITHSSNGISISWLNAYHALHTGMCKDLYQKNQPQEDPKLPVIKSSTHDDRVLIKRKKLGTC